jgi:hypothetical protein
MRINTSLVVIGFLLTALLLMLTAVNFNPPAVLTQNALSNSITFQQTPLSLPAQQDGSEIGSTDGILIMGIVIVLIVTLPLIFQKRK